MLPALGADGNVPRGVHSATWQEFASRFGTTRHRRRLLAGLKAALQTLRAAGCQRAYINGGFVTAKKTPEDFDACWDTAGVNPENLDPVFLTFEDGRAAQKAKFYGEFFPARLTEGGSGLTFLEFFQVDKNTGSPKGIVLLELRDLPR